jgi:hypothetical protein
MNSDPIYDFHLPYQPPVVPRVDANVTVRKALALMARESVLDDRRDAEELLARQDWTVYFP